MNFLVLILFLFSSLGFAKSLQVPENCVQERMAPCLAQVSKDEDFLVKIENINFRLTNETIVKWISFDEDIKFEIIKGYVHVQQNDKKKTNKSIEVVEVNGVSLNRFPVLVRKDDDSLEVLDLKTYFAATFKLPIQKDQQPSVNRFLDKAEFVRYVAPFYRTTNSLNAFLKSVVADWKVKFHAQANSQTNVLKRAIASAEAEKQRVEAERIENQIKNKKVREQFFYRTFYR